jgi:hypothetical protein
VVAARLPRDRFGDYGDGVARICSRKCRRLSDDRLAALVAHEMGHCLLGDDEDLADAFARRHGWPIW